METQTGQLAPNPMISSGYSVPLDYVITAVSFFLLGFLLAIVAVRASRNDYKVIR